MFDNFKKRPKVSAIIVAAGNGTRMNIQKRKQLIEINEIPVIAHTMMAFENSDITDEIIIVTKEDDILAMWDIAKAFNITKLTEIVSGGTTRTDSVKNGLSISKYEYVAIHDGVRPCVSTEDIEKTVTKAFKTGASALGCPVTDTLKKVDENGYISDTVNREGLWSVQTPQVFKKDLLLRAYEEGNTEGATDDCMLLESIGIKVSMVEGGRNNIKVTVQDDIDIVSALLAKENKL